MSKSKKKVESIVSAMGVFMTIITNLVELIKKFGGTTEDLHRLATPEGRETLEEVARVIVKRAAKKIPDHLVWWQEFYREEGIEIDFDSFEIPERPKSSSWLIIVASGMTYNKVIQALNRKFSIWLYNIGDRSLGKVLDLRKEQRLATSKPYAIWVRANIEADQDQKGKSAKDIGNVLVISLMERLLLEIFYFSYVTNRHHLDVENYTFCLGSSDSNGFTSKVGFNIDYERVEIDFINSECSYDNLRPRRVFF
ncbi:MAG: hypothetical protein PF549_03720 [Patescibacteria group bacterium]|nr:hypothetical protein [Patescibacteria group bacterium]